MKALLTCVVLLAACAPRALPLPAGHPARPDTPPAPVAEPSRTLRGGAPPAEEPQAPEPHDHRHHHHGGSR
jgi:hypothetical protein